jgi:hypothetical protein
MCVYYVRRRDNDVNEREVLSPCICICIWGFLFLFLLSGSVWKLTLFYVFGAGVGT